MGSGYLAIALSIAGCSIFPPDNIWNTRVDHLPVATDSPLWVETIGADKPLHPDFGSGLYNDAPIGIPFVVVPGTQERVAVSFEYHDESDPGPYPVPPDAPIEGGLESKGDRHVLIVDKDACKLYELFSAYKQDDGSWKAGSGAIWDLNSNKLRPRGWTSADAAGFALLPGLVRYEEVEAGEIKHAIRFTIRQTRRQYVWPATHFASRLTGNEFAPMGQRFRLRADFDISGFSRDAQVILTAMKRYGMMIADNGSDWFISGVPDERWNNEVLRELRRVRGRDFEAVETTGLQLEENSAAAKQPEAQ